MLTETKGEVLLKGSVGGKEGEEEREEKRRERRGEERGRELPLWKNDRQRKREGKRAETNLPWREGRD